jgi:hypothetical protein
MACHSYDFRIERKRGPITSHMYYWVYENNTFVSLYYLKFNAKRCIKRRIKEIKNGADIRIVHSERFIYND